MIWADRVAKELSGKTQHVDDMFTPSGFAHVGSLRGPVLHDVMARVLREQDSNTVFTYIFNDFDPVDSLPPEYAEKFADYMGFSLSMTPSPDPKYRSMAEFFAADFTAVLQNLGVQATYLSSWDMYHEGKFNDVIRIALDHKDKILSVYKQVAGYAKKTADWYPFQVVCPNCHKLGSTKVTGWDGVKVKFTCEPAMVSWAKGCGLSGEISPFDGAGKLPWKVDWPAHWTVLGITFEGAGKDHASRGGSYDIAFELCKDVFKIQKPYYFPYEFFLFGGKKMSSSKGVGLKGRDLTTILPPELARFLIVRTQPRQALEFDPVGMTIPDLFDEFDRCAQAYWEDPSSDLGRIFNLSQVNSLYEKSIYLPRFRDIATYIQQPSQDVKQKVAAGKGVELTADEKEILSQRITYAGIWLEHYAPDEEKNQILHDIPESAALLDQAQKQFLSALLQLVKEHKDQDALQKNMFDVIKNSGIEPKKAFQAIYVSLTGKTHGPKAAAFLLSIDPAFLQKRFTEVIDGSEKHLETNEMASISVIDRPELCSIDRIVREKYPSMTIAIAIIKGVQIKKQDPELEKRKQEVVRSLQGITNEEINALPEIQSYRKLYREMGIDWHSRRPSPEALLRRLAAGKELYSVNTCVDAYNLIVLKHHISIGAFDYDHIHFPTKVRYAGKGESILLLGDQEPTVYTEKEIAYFDSEGGYNLDFNYRDAQRTLVTEQTKNIWINIDGIFDISPDQVYKSLQETLQIITEYCGGTVELSGIIK